MFLQKGLMTILLLIGQTVYAENLLIATAANFKPTLEKLVKEFELSRQLKTKISVASSGVLYTQIKHGAPFDIFLSADANRPQALETITHSKSFAYAIGNLVYWETKLNAVNEQDFRVFQDTLAIANPATAPYGKAAIAVLGKLRPNYISEIKSTPLKIIKGNNINQAFQFVDTGNAQAGLLSKSQMVQNSIKNYWPVPKKYYSHLEQWGILLNTKNLAAASFIHFLHGKVARNIIRTSGYDLPPIVNDLTGVLKNDH